ncbi:Electron transfer DM13 [Catalinimonas alkaloidigena]|uniref:Electron transfer DM13 n=1 Tax=Catalinimonas alkaloidigena TaxID=1075417 RepID=A0A1G9AFG9_9BACT|nr:DM13 domain-containing protein [Catalinimonas alkaloidigena]SDK26109.1 Electron transfer DM13 [Catalinimonas alkaloidigena]
MKYLTLLCLALLFAQCARHREVQEMFTEADSTGTAKMLLAETALMDSPVHQTSGKAEVYGVGSQQQELRLVDFRTDAGPDLKVYLATDTKASAYVSLGDLKGTSGNFSYTLPASFDYETYPYVLIWCEDFSVLFGSGELMAAP